MILTTTRDFCYCLERQGKGICLTKEKIANKKILINFHCYQDVLPLIKRNPVKEMSSKKLSNLKKPLSFKIM